MTRDIVSQVVVNGRFLARRVTGVERYGREILRYFETKCRVESMRSQGLTGHLWEQFLLPTKLDRYSILWSPANTGPVVIPNQALTIHDLSPLEHPEWFRASFAAWYRLLLPILARRVNKVFTPSEYVKRKVVQRFGIKHVTVTPNGVDRSVFHPNAKQTTFDLPESYILFVGTLEPRKNLSMLLHAWNETKDDFRETSLIVVGVSRNVFRSIHVSYEVERVRFLGYVDDKILAGLYANATLFVLPSQDEGFGLPALEAMASGTPLIVSDGGALPEIVGEAGLIFKLHCYSPATLSALSEAAVGRDARSRNQGTEGPRREAAKHDTNQLSNALIQCLSNAQLRSELKEKGLARAREFSWETTAELVWNNLNEI